MGGIEEKIQSEASDHTVEQQVFLPKDKIVEVVTERVLLGYKNHEYRARVVATLAERMHKGHFDKDTRRMMARSDRHRSRLEHLLYPYKESLGVIEKYAREYAIDMAPDFDPQYFKNFTEISRTIIFKNLLRNVQVKEDVPGVIDKIKSLMKDNPVNLVPNHVCNADHIPLCHAFNQVGLPQPVILAGANLFQGESEEVLPRLNAYKVRRDYLDSHAKLRWLSNPVYNRVLIEHDSLLWDNNILHMPYIEGTRSRDGRLGDPMIGIVGMIWDYVKETGRKAVFAIISLSYTVVPEDTELEEGRQGKHITDADWVKKLQELDKEYGQLGKVPIYINFSEPVILDEDLVRKTHLGGKKKFARQLMQQIGEGIVSTPTYKLAHAIRETRHDDSFDLETIEDTFCVAKPDVTASSITMSYEELDAALRVFSYRGFIEREGKKRSILNMPLIEQYANRIAHLTQVP